jgi:hypothetical protein
MIGAPSRKAAASGNATRRANRLKEPSGPKQAPQPVLFRPTTFVCCSRLSHQLHGRTTLAMPVKFSDLELAFDFVSSDPFLGDHHAFVCRRTGKIYWQFEASEPDELEDELPDDIEDEEKYLPVPGKRELDLGKPLVLDFAREFLPDDFHEVRHMFSKRHAYRNFRALLLQRRTLERWYEFESKATKQALRDWCEQNSIEIDLTGED